MSSVYGPNPTVQQIVKLWLGQNGYDGLCTSDADCGCDITDLFPCQLHTDEIRGDCHAAYERVENGERGWYLEKEATE